MTEVTPAQVIARMLKDLNIGELKAIEDLAFSFRMKLQKVEDDKLKEALK